MAALEVILTHPGLQQQVQESQAITQVVEAEGQHYREQPSVEQVDLAVAEQEVHQLAAQQETREQPTQAAAAVDQ